MKLFFCLLCTRRTKHDGNSCAFARLNSSPHRRRLGLILSMPRVYSALHSEGSMFGSGDMTDRAAKFTPQSRNRLQTSGLGRWKNLEAIQGRVVISCCNQDVPLPAGCMPRLLV